VRQSARDAAGLRDEGRRGPRDGRDRVAVGGQAGSFGIGVAGIERTVLGRAGRRFRRGRHLRETEVEHFDLAACRHQDVARLQVAVHDPRGMRRDEDIGDLLRQPEPAGRIETLHRPTETAPFDQFEHQPVVVVALDVVVDPADIRVVELGENLRFASEPRAGRGVEPAGAVDHLQGDPTLQRLATPAYTSPMPPAPRRYRT
jgi:hypothetical protein